MMRPVKAAIPMWRRALRVVAIIVTVLSIGAMLYPDTVARPLLELGLAGQFGVGLVLVGALVVEILARVTAVE